MGDEQQGTSCSPLILGKKGISHGTFWNLRTKFWGLCKFFYAKTVQPASKKYPAHGLCLCLSLVLENVYMKIILRPVENFFQTCNEILVSFHFFFIF